MRSATILIVEDDAPLRASVERSLRRRGYTVLTAGTAAEAERLLYDHSINLALLDVRLPDRSGLDVLAIARELDGETAVVMFSAFPEVKTAVRAMKAGARDFLVKPFELEELHLTVERALETRELRRSVERLERERRSRAEVGVILGRSAGIEHVREQIRRVAATDTPVLVVGDTGTGKELVADSIHRLSQRAGGPMIKVNCSAFSERLLESELFGHEKGAFTDASEARAGLFEMCDGGTLFFDEISEMRPELQAKLLRVIEGHPFHRIGGRREVRTDVRVLAASNRNLPGLIRKGRFREDLYFRLNVFRIEVPPLRTRGEDVTELARHFLERCAAAVRKPAPTLTADAAQVLRTYDWPGNVRELRNVMERAVILCEGDEVEPLCLPAEIRASAFVQREAKRIPCGVPTLAEVERRYIEHVLDSVEGNISEAARLLGIARNTLKARMAGRPSA